MTTPEPAAQLPWVILSKYLNLDLQYQNVAKQNCHKKTGGFTTRQVNQLIYLSACLWVGLFIYAEHILKSAVLFEIIM